MRPNKDPVSNGDPLRNENESLDLAAATDTNTTANLDKSADLCLVPDLASIEIDQIRLEDLDVPPQHNIRFDHCFLLPPENAFPVRFTARQRFWKAAIWTPKTTRQKLHRGIPALPGCRRAAPAPTNG